MPLPRRIVCFDMFAVARSPRLGPAFVFSTPATIVFAVFAVPPRTVGLHILRVRPRPSTPPLAHKFRMRLLPFPFLLALSNTRASLTIQAPPLFRLADAHATLQAAIRLHRATSFVEDRSMEGLTGFARCKRRSISCSVTPSVREISWVFWPPFHRTRMVASETDLPDASVLVMVQHIR